MSVIIRGFGTNSKLLTRGFGPGLISIIVKIIYATSTVAKTLFLRSERMK